MKQAEEGALGEALRLFRGEESLQALHGKG